MCLWLQSNNCMDITWEIWASKRNICARTMSTKEAEKGLFICRPPNLTTCLLVIIQVTGGLVQLWCEHSLGEELVGAASCWAPFSGETFCPNSTKFLHGHIRHIHDILQLWCVHWWECACVHQPRFLVKHHRRSCGGVASMENMNAHDTSHWEWNWSNGD